MATITIDGVEYDQETLSEEAKAQLSSLQFVQVELQRLEAKTAVYKTAQINYSSALKSELEKINQ